MGAVKDRYLEVLLPIIDIAEENNNCISYELVMDLLKEQSTESQIARIETWIQALKEEGVIIENGEGENGYESDYTDSNAFIPADVKITPET